MLQQVADAIKIPNAALRFKPTREQIQAMRGESAGGGGSGGWQGRGSNGSGGRGSDSGTSAGSGGTSGGGRPGRDYGDKKPVYKLVDGQPKLVLVKPGLTDGSVTQMVEGDLQPGDLLVTEIQGVSAAPRKTGAF